MTEEKKQQPKTATPQGKETSSVLASNDTRTPRTNRAPQRGGADRPGRPPRRARGGRRGQEDRARSEFDQKVISLRRVARVVAGGRRFSFSATVVAGDKKGRVGVGLGKGIDTALAMEKAFRDAKKKMIRLALTPSKSIPHDVQAKYATSLIALRPSPARGIVAGSSVRTVLELAGVTDVTAKIHSRSKNKLNNARATIKALEDLRN